MLLLAVGAIEVLILYKVNQERRERAVLISEMKATRVELGRESYVAMLKETLGSARTRVYFVSHTLTSTMGADEKDAMFALYQPGRDHRCITGTDPGKIREMWEQHRRGVAVRVNELVMRSTFRYQVCDGSVAVLGFADEGDDASRKGIRVANVYFGRMLQEHFLRTWELSTPFLKYVADVIARTNGPELAFSLPELASQWSLTDDECTALSVVSEQRLDHQKPADTGASQVAHDK